MKKESEKDIIKLAHKRFAIIDEAERKNRKLWAEDLKFANGDSDNGYQWDDEILKSREGRPCLTINKVKKHNRQIINEARKNKPSIRVYPVDDKADKKTAEIYNDLIRHIENNSNANYAYDVAGEYAVDAGLGYWKITTDYIDETSSDQEIYIEPILNPLTIYLPEPEIKNGMTVYDHAFEIKDMKKEDFEHDYGKDKTSIIQWDIVDGGWKSEDSIRLAGYYYTEYKDNYLYAKEDGTTFIGSELEGEDTLGTKIRKVSTKKIKWCLIAGDEILETKDWPGKYIPIIPLIGNEIIIEGKREIKGHTRMLKAPQQMYNYWASSATEFVSLQGKQPYLAPAEAIEGYEKYWDDANTNTLPYLPYNAIDKDTGNPLPQPSRQQPPIMAPAYIQGMQIASEELLSISGQENAQFGVSKSGQSGRALDALQDKSDLATFHFTDNKSRAIRFTGRLLIDLIPIVYDTPRILRILGEDGSPGSAEINPKQQESMIKHQDSITGEIKNIYNLSVGTFDVVIAVGASFGTKRREAFQALTQIAAQNPQAWQIAGDLIMKSADFPFAEELAERFKKTLPPGLQDSEDGKPEIPPEIQAKIQQDQQQIQQYQNITKALDETIQKMQEEIEGNEIDQYKAETERLKVTQASMSPEQIQQIVIQTLRDLSMSNNMQPDQDQEVMQQPNQQQEINPNIDQEQMPNQPFIQQPQRIIQGE